MTSLPESREAGAATQSTPTRIPDFFIVGHAKSGTTALYEMLRRHPQIFMPEYKWGAGKEPWYFSRDNPHPQRNGERSIEFTGRRAMTLAQYSALFAAAREDQLVGEASSSYLWSKTAARRIAKARPDARIIAILREPASFLRSLHLQLLQNHHECVTDFRKALDLDQPRREGREIPDKSYWPSALIYSDRVRYTEQLRRYEAVFPSEQILVLIYDDFRLDNAATVRRALRFLDVDDDVELELVEANPTIAIRSRRIDELRLGLRSGRTPILRALRTVGRTVTSRRVRKGLYYPLVRRAVWGEPPPVDEELMLELRERFKDEVVAVGEHLGRDLVALWGYDRIG
jgi:hypothetical protein